MKTGVEQSLPQSAHQCEDTCVVGIACNWKGCLQWRIGHKGSFLSERGRIGLRKEGLCARRRGAY